MPKCAWITGTARRPSTLGHDVIVSDEEQPGEAVVTCTCASADVGTGAAMVEPTERMRPLFDIQMVDSARSNRSRADAALRGQRSYANRSTIRNASPRPAELATLGHQLTLELGPPGSSQPGKSSRRAAKRMPRGEPRYAGAPRNADAHAERMDTGREFGRLRQPTARPRGCCAGRLARSSIGLGRNPGRGA